MSFDFEATKRLVNGHSQDNYSWVYAQTNEHLRELYSNVDFMGKNVLSVASSGDQMFMAYAFGAKHVDLFDVNKLTFYYYYLRLWTIQYFDRFYPKIPFHKRYLNDLLRMVKVKDEAEEMALNYWHEILDGVNSAMLANIFIYEGKHLDGSKNELSIIKDSLTSDKSTFYNFDLSNYFKCEDKYDIVVASNIVDWLHGSEAAIERYKDNLYNLLNDNGIVLCSDLGAGGASRLQKRIFEKEFDYHKYPAFKQKDNSERPSGFEFQKKR